MADRFEPKILAFCCNWCSYAGADLAGVSRMQYPANVRVIRVMCSGRIRPEAVFKALDNGIDGVLVLGCHIGDCHYLTGNHRTAKRMLILEMLLSHMGVNPKRLRVDWISASEGEKFQRTITEFTEEIRKLGPENGGSHGRTG